MYYVYILKSKKVDKLYIGYTADLKQRFVSHNQGRNRATKAYVPFDLVYYEAYGSSKDARQRESQLKQFKQAYTRLKERIAHSIRGQN